MDSVYLAINTFKVDLVDLAMHSSVATVGLTGACAPLSAFRARSSAKYATHVILRDDPSQYYHAVVNMKNHV